MVNSYWKVIIECSVQAEDALSAFLFEHNCQGFYRESGRIIACFSSYDDALSFCNEMEEKGALLISLGLTDELSFKIETAPIVQWDEAWKKTLRPVKTGKRLIVLAPWHEYEGSRIKIVIEPGMAFGTGHHATTALCLEEVERVSEAGCRSLLDLGTGTGILAIAARKLGIPEVFAIDIDQEALEIARRNALINATEDIKFSSDPVDRISREFDAIVANLTLETIKGLFKTILNRCKRGGTVILSGVLSEQRDDAELMLQRAGLSDYTVKELDQWLCITVLN